MNHQRGSAPSWATFVLTAIALIVSAVIYTLTTFATKDETKEATKEAVTSYIKTLSLADEVKPYIDKRFLDIEKRLTEFSDLVGVPGPQGRPGKDAFIPPELLQKIASLEDRADTIGDSADSSAINAIQRDVNELRQQITQLKSQISGPPAFNKEERVSQLRANADNKRSIEKDGLIWEHQNCVKRSSNYLDCRFSVTNTTSNDKKACIGEGNKLVLADGFDIDFVVAYVGNQKKGHSVCDTVAPLVKTVSGFYINSNDLFIQDLVNPIQFVRFVCGSGCKLELYDVSVEQG